eukprot:TRINITY_DN468_c2_g1_i2.p1 TRINITY_DN468_c2_g1~~TRINITY_DN468_c2_g1_i2.p1  ORF type:complete len:272 (-),score=114.76 TRINITY_DN468_c2_g1_i2:73-888(-)
MNIYISEVHLIGRRGPAQAAFTTKELRELIAIENCSVYVDPKDLELNENSLKELSQERARKRQFELISKCTNLSTDSRKKIILHFLKSPLKFNSINDKLSSITLQENKLIGEVGKQQAIPIQDLAPIDLNCSIVFRSVGYKSKGIEDIPFNNTKGIVINNLGKVYPGLYVSGWLKRGPNGIIGTNKFDSQETIEQLFQDLETNQISNFSTFDNQSKNKIFNLLIERNVKPISFIDWLKIDAFEKNIGNNSNPQRPRVKITSKEQMIKIATS